MAVARVRSYLNRWQIPLNGTYDGTNRVFSLTEKYIKGSSRLFHNGRHLKASTDGTLLTGSYLEAESGGAGSGFDAFVLLEFTPAPHSKLTVDYYVA